MSSTIAKINVQMDQAHATLRDLNRGFTAGEAHEIIAEFLKISPETAAGLFAIMRIMKYIHETEESIKINNCLCPLFRVTSLDESNFTLR